MINVSEQLHLPPVKISLLPNFLGEVYFISLVETHLKLATHLRSAFIQASSLWTIFSLFCAKTFKKLGYYNACIP